MCLRKKIPSFLVWKQSILFIFIAAIFTSCSKAPESPIRIGINIWPGYEYLFLAKEKGFFADEGLSVDLIELGSLTDVRRAYELRKVDGMAATLIEVVEAYRQSGRLSKTVLVTDFSEGADSILAKPSISTVSELKGKRIGTEFASLGLFLVYRALEVNGLAIEDVEILNLTQDELIPAMRNEEIDAVMSFPPVSIQLEKEFKMQPIFDSSEIAGEVVDVVTLAPEIVEKYPDIAQKFQRIWDRALAYADQHPDESYQFLAERQGITAQEFVDSLEGLTHLRSDQQEALMKPGGNVEKALQVIEDYVLPKWGHYEKPPVRAFID